MKKIILFFILFAFVSKIEAEEYNLLPNYTRPKMGLCLSGGGAKGLIYVGLLKLIDSLEIKVDYITGTSMGSIIGGLYAIGYSGKELEEIAITTKWSKYLTNSVPLNKISIEEKSEYGRYMIELNSNSLTPDLPIAVINGQNIMAFLNDLTFRVQHIKDFNKFPIPFKCLATDIVTGKPVIIDKGSLALALRTSMAIPSFFSPIDSGKMLLVDGGLVKNFPVEYVKQMGAEFIIGANCSGVLLKKKELKTLVNMMEQTTSFSIAADYEKQKLMCDILLDYNEVLKNANIGTMDFKKANEILLLGEAMAHQYIEPLKQLATQQEKYKHLNLDTTNLNKSDSIHFEDIRISLDESNLNEIVRNKIRLKDFSNISKDEINKAVDEIYGTRYFENVYYYLENKGNNHNLVFKTIPTKKYSYKLGIHYDNEMSAGIIVNMTVRNVLFNASRFISTFDISDNPKIRIGYQVYLGNKGFYFSTNQYFERAKQNAFYKLQNLGTYKHLFYQMDVLMNYAIQTNSYVSGGVQFKWGNLKQGINSSDRPERYRNIFTLSKRPNLNTSILIKYNYNTLNLPLFPTKGIQTFIQSEFIYAGKTTSTLRTESIIIDSLNNIQIQTSDSSIQYKFSPYLKLSGFYEHLFKLHSKVTIGGRIDFGMIFSFRPSDKTFANPLVDAYYIGGVESRGRERQPSYIPFWGNHEVYIQNLNFLSTSVSLQYEPVKNLIFIPKVSVVIGDNGNTSVYGDRGVINNFKANNLLFAHSEGITVAYKTPIGPLQLNLSKASNVKKPILYFSLGFRI